MAVMEINTVGIVGTAVAAPKPYRNIYGKENVYALWVDTVRDSGAADRILVLFQEDKVDPERRAAVIEPGSRVEVTGKIQTYKDMKRGHVQLFVWGLYLAVVQEGSNQLNTVYMQGEIAKEPIYRETPLGRRITDMVLRIPSAFTEGFYSYVPCIAWEKLADVAAELPENTVVYMEGRLQSREYTKKTKSGDKVLTAWEVSVCKLNEGENQNSGN